MFDGQGNSVTIVCDRHSSGNYGDGANVGLIGRLGAGDYDSTELWPSGVAVRNVAVYGSVYANRSVGGIVGKIGKTADTAIIENCANFASIEATDAKGTGGIVGASWNLSLVKNCYNAGTVKNTGKPSVGGISGSNEGQIVNCYNVGTVIASGSTASIATDNGGGTYTNCYWLTGTADMGVYDITSDEIMEKTAAEMKSDEVLTALGSAFAEDGGNINSGYPILSWQSSSGSGSSGGSGGGSSSGGSDDKDDTGDDTGSDTGDMPFVDVASDDHYYDALVWAVENGITDGTSDTTFSPNMSCTRAQMVTFLWRAAGSPEPAVTGTAFTDVDTDGYYYKALLWAVENGVTDGTSDTTFSPDDVCTRAQMVTFLHRCEDSVTPGTSGTNFKDVDAAAYYYMALLWAVENGITDGTSDTTFSPDALCTRAQMVTFLYRYMAA